MGTTRKKITYNPELSKSVKLVIGVGGATVAGSQTVNYAGIPPASYGPSTIPPTNAGTYQVRVLFTSSDSNYNNAQGTGSIVINKKLASVTPDNFTRQYSDPNPIFTGALTGFLTSDGVTATYSTIATTASAPGTYDIVATLSPAGALGNYTITYNTGTLTVTQEDARVTYTGPMFVTTASETATSVVVPLSATVQDITAVSPGSDSTPGDIRNATVTFLKDNSVILGCMNLPVNLVNPADTKTGTAGCNWTASVGNYTITVMVGGYYKDDGLGETETSLEVAPGGGTNFITGRPKRGVKA
jgi:hypothetical protein